jgi:hypothetical protein
MAVTNRENRKGHVAEGGLDLSLTPNNEHHYIFHAVYDFGIPGFQPREFLLSQIWKWTGEKELTTVYSDTTSADIQEQDKYLRASSTVMLKYEELDPLGAIPQTRVTFVQYTNVRGAIPGWVVNTTGIDVLMAVSKMRKRFDKSPAIDAASNLRLEMRILNHDEPYTEVEEEILRDGQAQFIALEALKGKELKMPLPAVKAKLAFKADDKRARGFVTTTVRV